MEPDAIAANFYDPRDYDLGHDVLQVDGDPEFWSGVPQAPAEVL